jgi:hypothetical protein
MADMIVTASVQSPARDPTNDTRRTEPPAERLLASGTRMAEAANPREPRLGDERKIAAVMFGL